MRDRFALCSVPLSILTILVLSVAVIAQDPASNAAPVKAPSTKKEPSQTKSAAAQEAKLRRLDPEHEVWIDETNRQVVVGGEVSLQRGMLEMFACLKGTKEHESVVAANTAAYVVHAALMAIGAEPGTPVKFEPAYKPATGTTIDITVEWKDADGKLKTTKAQDWVRHMKTGEPLEYSWVFAGSGFWEDEETGKKHYMAEGGDFICVSNFPSAMLDLPVESSMDNDGLVFEAFTDRIPERGTKVRLFLKPRLEKKSTSPAGRPGKAASKASTKPAG